MVERKRLRQGDSGTTALSHSRMEPAGARVGHFIFMVLQGGGHYHYPHHSRPRLQQGTTHLGQQDSGSLSPGSRHRAVCWVATPTERPKTRRSENRISECFFFLPFQGHIPGINEEFKSRKKWHCLFSEVPVSSPVWSLQEIAELAG